MTNILSGKVKKGRTEDFNSRLPCQFIICLQTLVTPGHRQGNLRHGRASRPSYCVGWHEWNTKNMFETIYVVKITFCRAGNGMPLCGGGHMPLQCDTPFQVDRAVRSRQPRPPSLELAYCPFHDWPSQWMGFIVPSLSVSSATSSTGSHGHQRSIRIDIMCKMCFWFAIE